MDRKRFEKIWREFTKSKFDVGLTRRKTAWNILRFIECKNKTKLKKNKEIINCV